MWGCRSRFCPPGVQDADHADLGAQVFAIEGDLEQGLSAGGEQQVVEQTRVLQSQHVEFVGHSEHNMEVAGGQEFAFAGRQPALAGLCLALGAVPISARVVGDGLMTAVRTGIAMTCAAQKPLTRHKSSRTPGFTNPRLRDISRSRWFPANNKDGLGTSRKRRSLLPSHEFPCTGMERPSRQRPQSGLASRDWDCSVRTDTGI